MNLQLPGINPLRLDGIQNDKAFTAKALDLQVGQLLKAVVAINPQEGRLLLKFDGNLLQARSNQSFHAGEVLTLKVGGNPKEIILTVLDRDNRQAIVQQAMRQSLPVQKPAQQFLNQLQQLTTGQDSKQLPLPPAVLKASSQLLNNIAKLSQVQQGAGLKQAFEDIGIFLEKKLLTQKQVQHNSASHDHKALLLQLKKAVNSALEQAKLEVSQEKTKPHNLRTPMNNTHPQGPLNNLTQKVALPFTTSDKQVGSDNKAAASAPRQDTAAKATDNVQQTRPEQKLAVMKSSVHKSLSLPLPGAKPQPIKHEPLAPINGDNRLQMLEGLKDQLTQTLARVQSHQLSSLGQETGVQNHFLFDLPVKVGNKIDVLPFLIQEEESNSTAEEQHKKTWSVMLALDLDNLGEMQIKVQLHDTQVSVNFWSINEQAATLIRNKQERLKSELANEELELKCLHCHQGLVESNIDSKAITLLDIKA